MNQQSKPWYLSKGFVGPMVTAVLFSLRSLGIADVDTDTVLGILYQGAEFAGIVAGMAGRAMAEKRLTLGPTPAACEAGSTGRSPARTAAQADAATPSAEPEPTAVPLAMARGEK